MRSDVRIQCRREVEINDMWVSMLGFRRVSTANGGSGKCGISLIKENPRSMVYIKKLHSRPFERLNPLLSTRSKPSLMKV